MRLFAAHDDSGFRAHVNCPVRVCLDEQYEEATKLLADPDYRVDAPVDVKAFDRALKRAGWNGKATKRFNRPPLSVNRRRLLGAVRLCVSSTVVCS